MDAAYLNKNMGGALAEALTAMSVRCPDDKVEYIGKFLLEYVARRKNKSAKDKDCGVQEAKAMVERDNDAKAKAIINEKDTENLIHSQKYPEFLDSLKAKKNKS